jgi:RNA polymerase sigma-70 factor (ECF subfamily)
MATDFELLDAWAGGNRPAAQQLFDRYMVPLYQFFYNKIPTGIEDAVQDTLVACIEARDRFRRESSFRSYLFGTARHVLWERLKQSQREPVELDPEQSSLHELGVSPSSFVAKRAEHRLLLDALRRLPFEQQVLLELYHFQDLTAIELATMYSISEVALRGRLHRAKERLRTELERLPGAPELLESTWTNFESWAKRLHETSE